MPPEKNPTRRENAQWVQALLPLVERPWPRITCRDHCSSCPEATRRVCLDDSIPKLKFRPNFPSFEH